MVIYKWIILGGVNLFYIIFGLLSCSLAASVLLQSREQEKWLWLKIIAIYLCYFFSFNIGKLKIPVLIIGAYFVIMKKSKLNRRVKLQTLVFSLILFITVNYVIPQVSFKQVFNLGKQVALENRFDSIDSIHHYSEDASIQNKLRRYNSEDPQIMFDVWVYDNNDIAIKDYEWIWMNSSRELNTYWQLTNYNEEGYSEAYIRFNKTGEEYLGIFKKDKKGREYLDTAVKGKFKQNGAPRPFFNSFGFN